MKKFLGNLEEIIRKFEEILKNYLGSPKKCREKFEEIFEGFLKKFRGNSEKIFLKEFEKKFEQISTLF